MRPDLRSTMDELEGRLRAGLSELEGRGRKARKDVERFLGQARREAKSCRRELDTEIGQTAQTMRRMVEDTVQTSIDQVVPATKRALHEMQTRLGRVEKKLDELARGPARRAPKRRAPRKRAAPRRAGATIRA